LTNFLGRISSGSVSAFISARDSVRRDLTKATHELLLESIQRPLWKRVGALAVRTACTGVLLLQYSVLMTVAVSLEQ
jgi:hypothetical protein